MLEELLKEHFFLAENLWDENGYLTEEGEWAYERLKSMLYSLRKIVYFDIKNVIKQLDNIEHENSRGRSGKSCIETVRAMQTAQPEEQ